jgi:hypothetical protein
LLIIALFAFAQQAVASEWVKSFGSIEHDRYSFTAKDANGNLFVAIPISGTTDFDPNPNKSFIVPYLPFVDTPQNQPSIAISKFDSKGNFLWVKFISSYGPIGISDFKIDAKGNLYFTGNYITNYALYSSGFIPYSTDFDPDLIAKTELIGSSIREIHSNTGLPYLKYYKEGYICKWDNDGNFVWVKEFKGIGAEDVNQIAIDNSDNSVIVVGTVYMLSNVSVDCDPDSVKEALITNNGFDAAAFIVKLDLDGNYRWSRKLDYGGVKAVDVDSQHNIYMGGYFPKVMDVDPGVGVHNLVATNYIDAYITKWNGAGEFIWAKSTYSSTGEDDVSHVKADPLGGGVYLSGLFEGNMQLAPNSDVLKSNGWHDAYFAKLNADGNYVFSKAWGGNDGDYVNCMDADVLGNVFLGGYTFSSKVDFDPGTNPNVIEPVGESDAYISTFNADGTYRSTKVIASMGLDWTSSITPLGDGSLFATGAFSFTANASNSNLSVEAVGGYDIWMLKMDAANTGINKTFLDAKVSIYPNPTFGKAVLNLSKETNEVTVTIRSAIGGLISTQSYNDATKVELSFPKASGLYLVELKDAKGHVQTLKVLKK